jgi:Kelch motif
MNAYVFWTVHSDIYFNFEFYLQVMETSFYFVYFWCKLKFFFFLVFQRSTFDAAVLNGAIYAVGGYDGAKYLMCGSFLCYCSQHIHFSYRVLLDIDLCYNTSGQERDLT